VLNWNKLYKIIKNSVQKWMPALLFSTFIFHVIF
jgi:hypothetical protein